MSWLYTKNGQQCGPISFDELRQLASTGQLDPRDYVWQEGMANWAPAQSIPHLFSPASFQAQQFQGQMNPYGAGQTPYHVEPHRGTIVLVLGILGFVACGVFGIAAWIMGNIDLAAMREGRMDRTGEGITRAGQIMGIISTALMAISFCMGFAWIMIVITATMNPNFK